MSTPSTKHLITIDHPEVGDRAVTFRWAVEPPTRLYKKSEFTLNFPLGLDLAAVPAGVWWRIAILCLHSHWPLLAPCRIDLPIGLLPGEAELWLRLMRAQMNSLSTYGDGSNARPEIEIIARGPASAPLAIEDSGRCGTAFSGGKDSLLQTGLLAELTERPLLVTTTSQMPLLEDHLTERRRQVLEEVTRRAPVQLVEVESDYRANLYHGFAQDLGYQVSVNEITDVFLYLGALIAVGAALKVTHLFVASELEVQENISLNNEVVQHSHFMYSVATLSAVSELMKNWGMDCSSLTAALHSYQVQELLTKRYPHLLDLQYSCWRVRAGEAACNSCSQCLRIAFSLLSMGRRPSTIGLNLGRILRTTRKWQPSRLDRSATSMRPPLFPREIVSARLHAQVMRSILATRKTDVVSEVGLTPSKRLPLAGRWLALASYWRLLRIAKRYNPGP
ncbi:MAG: hypothetical protein ABI882_10885, partial [Acidobacteriota bacterium]